MLNTSELLELEEAMTLELRDGLTGILSRLNRFGQLENLLDLLGMRHLLQKESGYEVYKSGKIIVIGQSEVKQDVLLAVAKKQGIDKSRIELYLDYEDAKTFNFKKMQWQPSYSLVIVGPMPHSALGKGDYSSVIAAMEQEDGYPPVIRLGNGTLKITKSGFRDKLKELIGNGMLVCA